MMSENLFNQDMPTARRVDAVVVGAGLAGLYMLYRLRNKGMKVQVFEAGKDVGGTWYWNRYPGARCDVQSVEYSYSFSKELQQEWNWTERYPTQPEILKYIQHVAERFDLRKNILFNTRVASAVYNEENNRWHITTDTGEHYSATYCIMATGCLSSWSVPKIPGLDKFQGEFYHTGNWPHEGVEFKGKSVGVIGTGSSGIQSIPVIAQEADKVTVFQRTPNFSIPANNCPLDQDFIDFVKSNYDAIRQRARENGVGLGIFVAGEQSALSLQKEEVFKILDSKWGASAGEFMLAFNDVMTNEEANAVVTEYMHHRIKSIVKDQEVAKLLCPTDHPVGTKRICVDTDYYATFNRENVQLVDVRTNPIQAITENGLLTSDGKQYTFDVLVCATGFDAMTGALSKIDIKGLEGFTLKEKWEAGPRMYLGLMAHGFPNLFTITGPGSPSVLSNMITSIEQHVDWITDLISYMQGHGHAVIEPTLEAEDAWVEHVNVVAHYTLYPKANSWYLGANVPGKPRVFMPYVGGVGAYRQKCNEIAANGYEGFIFQSANAMKVSAVA